MEKSRFAITVSVILVAGLLVGGFAGYYISESSHPVSPSISVFAAGSLEYALGNHFNPQFRNTTGILVG
ncbi:MAG: hypothetical protein QXN26_03195, partial [Thermoplasmataceae archaeon]